MPMKQEIQLFSSSIYEIEEIMEENDTGNNNGNDTIDLIFPLLTFFFC